MGIDLRVNLSIRATQTDGLPDEAPSLSKLDDAVRDTVEAYAAELSRYMQVYEGIGADVTVKVNGTSYKPRTKKR